jgi:hypothetical protein
MPKANKRYNTGKNLGEAVSLITAASKNDFTIAIDGSTKFSINTSKFYFAVGDDYTADVLAFAINNPNNIVFSNPGQKIVITIPIKNPPLVDKLLDDWDLWIKTELGVNSSTTITDPSLLNIVE